jgi:molybdopterin-synthase adenylyltransferase
MSNASDNQTNINISRYSRQSIFAPIGPAGQQRICNATVLLIGCGALGSNLAGMMTRAGVGRLWIVDRDCVELSNLQRQVLFDEADAANNLPKAQAAAQKLRHINSQIQITPVVADVNHQSIEHFIDESGCSLILDGTDNLQTRLLINDAAIKHSRPWIYGACLSATGMAMVILPAGRPCLRCVIESAPEPGQMPTCETAGIISPIVSMVAAWQAAEALKLLSGNLTAINKNFVTFDLWQNRYHQMSLEPLTTGPGCQCCGRHDFEYLTGRGDLSTISLCGRNSVQVRPQQTNQKINLPDLAQRLNQLGPTTLNEFMLRLELTSQQMEITIFPDARAIIKGTSSIDHARSLYAKYIGH